MALLKNLIKDFSEAAYEAQLELADTEKLQKKFLKKKVYTIEDVHREFDNASQDLLDQANKLLEEENKKDEKLYLELARLGFDNSKSVDKVMSTIAAREESVETKRFILKYAEKYPKYKFITERRVKEICVKFHLANVPVDKFIGTIPREDAKDIVEFQVDSKDKELVRTSYNGGYRDRIHIFQHDIYVKTRIADGLTKKNAELEWDKASTTFRVVCTPDQVSLRPNESLNEYGEVVMKDPDPVVLAKVVGGWLIVTKWGLEAKLFDE